MHQATTYHWSLLEDVTGYERAGIRGIAVWRHKFLDFGEERGLELLRDSNLAVSSLSCAGGFTGTDGQSFEDSVTDALDALQWAIELRAGCLVVVPGSRGNHTLNHARRLLRDALRELGDVAGPHGVQIALLPQHGHPAARHSFLESLDSAAEFVDWCNHSHVGMVFDMFHACEERDLLKRIPKLVPRIRLVALTDARNAGLSDDERCLPGEGSMNLTGMVNVLEAGGYRGAYDVQLFSRSCRETDYDQLLANCQAALREIAPALFVTKDLPTSRRQEDTRVEPLPRPAAAPPRL
jgi:sugar phosphate isomerase/epimerase